MKDAANAGMKVHHKYQVLRVATYVAATEGEAEAKVVQRVMEERFRKELGINVHEGAHLAAVNDDVHGRISAKQNEFWVQEFRKAGLEDRPDTVDLLRVYRSVDINAYKQLCDNLDVEYRAHYLNFGSTREDFAKLRKLQSTPEGKHVFDMEEARRRVSLFPDSIPRPEIIFFIYFLPQKINQIRELRNHKEHQLLAYQAFVSQYQSCMNEISELNRLTQDSAMRLMGSFEHYLSTLKLDESDGITFARHEVYKYILITFH